MPGRIVAVHPSKRGKRRPHLEEPSDWDSLHATLWCDWLSNAPPKVADPELRHSNCGLAGCCLLLCRHLTSSMSLTLCWWMPMMCWAVLITRCRASWSWAVHEPCQFVRTVSIVPRVDENFTGKCNLSEVSLRSTWPRHLNVFSSTGWIKWQLLCFMQCFWASIQSYTISSVLFL